MSGLIVQYVLRNCLKKETKSDKQNISLRLKNKRLFC